MFLTAFSLFYWASLDLLNYILKYIEKKTLKNCLNNENTCLVEENSVHCIMNLLFTYYNEFVIQIK